jgi:outer membrane protein, heavy metal efflux system
MRAILLLGVVSLWSVAVATEAQEHISRLALDEAVRLATQANPTLRAKQFEYQGVAAGEITAGLRPNPTANFLAEQFAGASDASQSQYTFSVGQPIELGGKRQRRIDSARAATRVTGHELSDVQRQLVFQVKKSFTDALTASANLALADQNLQTLDELERIQRFRAEKGDISELELLRVQVQRFTFERDAADARQSLRAAKIALRAAVGSDRIAQEFEIVGDLAFRDIALTQADLYRRALANRPDLRAADAAREKGQADVRLARANAWWDVTPQIEYQRIGRDNTIGFGVSLPVRIFDRNQGEIARTHAEAKRLEATRDAVAVQALSEVDTSEHRLPGACVRAVRAPGGHGRARPWKPRPRAERASGRRPRSRGRGDAPQGPIVGSTPKRVQPDRGHRPFGAPRSSVSEARATGVRGDVRKGDSAPLRVES